MSEDAPLRNRLRTDLMDNQSVTLTAIGLGLVAFVLVSLDSSPLPVSSDFSAEFLLSLSLMDVAFVYDDYWPVEYRPLYAATWTVLCGAVTALVFVSVYELGLSQVGHTTASVAAFVIAVGVQFGSAILYARIR
jgi:hypothetical protein